MLIGDCSTKLHEINKDCEATENFVAKKKRQLVSVGTKEHPKWNLLNGNFKRIVGTVNCPCTGSDGNVMNTDGALRQILGQMGAMGLDAGAVAMFNKGDWSGADYIAAIGVCCVRVHAYEHAWRGL